MGLFTKLALIVLLLLAVLLNSLLTLFITYTSLFFTSKPFLFFLSTHLKLTLLFYQALVLSSLLLGFRRDDTFEILETLFQAVDLGAETEQLPVDSARFFVLFLTLESVTQGEIGVDVVLAVVDTLLQMIDGLWVLAPNAVQDTRVVVNDRVDWVEINRTVVIVERVCEFSSPFHVDAHVLQDTRLMRVVSNRILVLCESFLTVAKLFMDDTQVHFRFIVVRIKFKHLNKNY